MPPGNDPVLTSLDRFIDKYKIWYYSSANIDTCLMTEKSYSRELFRRNLKKFEIHYVKHCLVLNGDLFLVCNYVFNDQNKVKVIKEKSILFKIVGI